MKHLYLRLLLLLFCVPTLLIAQSTDATISGLVVDPSGRALPDTDIEIFNEATGVHYTNKTNGAGIYTVSILPPGQYRVQVSKAGFKTLIKPGITLNVQSAVALNFTMPLGATSESITVEAGTSLINTTDASVGTLIDRKFVENIPLNGRSFQDLISMTPGVVTPSPQSGSTLGVNGDFSVNGQRTESNYYTVDGVTANISSGSGAGGVGPATAGALAGATALGTTQSLIPVDGLQEFRVQSSTYSAEYGRSPGGQFSLATRSGANDLHGSVFDYLRNNFFDANDWFNDYYGKPIPALRQNDFGGTFGGPVWIPKLYAGKDRTFFFVAYEGLRLAQPTEAAIQYVPDIFMRQQAVPAIQPILNAFPIPNGVDYGTATSPSLAQFIAPFSLPSAIDSTSIRADHLLTPHLSLFFRFGDTPSSTSSRPYFALNKTSINTQTYTIGVTAQLSSRMNNEFRLGYGRSNSSQVGALDTFGGATPTNLANAMGAGYSPNALPQIEFVIAGIGTSLMSVGPTSNRDRQWNAVDTYDVAYGHHDIRVGIDYRHIASADIPVSPAIIAAFITPGSILAAQPAIGLASNYISATALFNQTALFVQDQWTLHPRFSVSMGLRWELSPPPTGPNGKGAYTLQGEISNPASLVVAPRGTPLWKTTWYNFAPRLGAAWIARQKSGMETVLHFGGGVFFDTANEAAANGFNAFGFEANNYLYGATLPYTQAQLTIPISAAPPYTNSILYAFPSHMQLPYTLEWNASLQQALGRDQTVTLTYVGSNGRRLVGKQELSLTNLNPEFGTVDYYVNGITSNYQALQLQFQRSVARGVHALASYTWSHSLDFGSSYSSLPLIRGNSDYDVRNNFQAGLSWDLPRFSVRALERTLLDAWGLDARANVRGGFPITLGGNQIIDPATGSTYVGELNLVPGNALWLYGPQFPGGREINKAAFSLPATGALGDAPRNFLRGFGATQINIAVRRSFHLHDALTLDFRAEAFNVFNHPNFGYVDPTYTDATFGQATQMLNSSLGTVAPQYQQGGARSMQFAVKLHF